MTEVSAPLALNELEARIDRLPRERIAVLPTGLQPLPRLAAMTGVERFYVKRDDLTGVGLGGNKSRGMEFILGEARAKNCDILVAGGGTEQSNHAVQCAASGCRVGMDVVVVLQRRPGARANGNALLRDLFGARTVWVESDPHLRDRTSSGATMRAIAEELQQAGRRPYVLESSLHPLSVIAYVKAVLELRDQLPTWNLSTRIYVTSEGAALGGLLLGTRLLGLPWEIIGLDWRPEVEGTATRLHHLIGEAAALLGLANPVEEAEIVILSCGGPEYGVGRPDSWSALVTAARLEGLILDPVYTSKGLAGVLGDLKARPFTTGPVVFVHTGGVAALFAYEHDLRNHLASVG